jgi:phosphohistidine phosphatase SixA
MRVLPISLALLVACGTPESPAPSEGPASTATREDGADVERAATVFFVRHAEKAKDGTPDPPLTDAGHERAQCLVDVLKQTNPKRLLTTQYQRTRQTLDPLATAFGRKTEVIPADDTAAWLETLRGLSPGSTTVVAGHSNTLPQLIGELGGRLHDLDDDGNLPSYEYDRLFVVTLDRAGRATSTHTLQVCATTPVVGK